MEQQVTSEELREEQIQELSELVRLRSTARIQEELAHAEKQLAALPSTAPEFLLKTKRFAVQSAKSDLEKAKERDRIQRHRPEGCKCLGMGGLDPELRYTPSGKLVVLFDSYCSCADGDRAKAEATRRRYDSRIKAMNHTYERVWQRAGFPKRLSDCTLGSFPISAQTAELVKHLKRPPGFSDEQSEEQQERISDYWRNWSRSWFFWGEYGRGKTGLAVSYANEWLWDYLHGEDLDEVGRTTPMLFKSTPDLFSELRDTYRGNGATECDLLKLYGSVPLLIMDDLGAEHVKDSGWLEDRLYQVIGRRHGEELTTVFTSNLNMERLAQKIGERVTWRIVEMCGSDHIVKVDGPNLRET